LWDKDTVLICIQIGFVQARLWEQQEGALLYEMPDDFVPEEIGVCTELQKATSKPSDNGHVVQPEVRGGMRSFLHFFVIYYENLATLNFG